EARQTRHLLVEPRVVLHRARAQRIHAHVDRVVAPRQAHEVAHHLRLAQARKADRAGALEAAEARIDRGRVRQIHARPVGLALLEQQRLLVVEPAMPREGFELRRRLLGAPGEIARMAHRRTSRSAAHSASMSASVLHSVAATSSRSRKAGSSPNSRLAGTPPSTPRTARADATSAAGFGSRTVN